MFIIIHVIHLSETQMDKCHLKDFELISSVIVSNIIDSNNPSFLRMRIFGRDNPLFLLMRILKPDVIKFLRN